MLNKLSSLAICLFLFLSLAQLSLGQLQPSTFDGWQVENVNSNITQSGEVVRLSTNGGGDYPQYNYPSIFLYKEFEPIGDFTFSAQVNAATLESCDLVLRRRLPITGFLDGISLEYGYHHGEGVFLTGRNYTGWTINEIAKGDPNVWYTMKLAVTRIPYTISTSVYDENGTCLGSVSVYDADFKFEDIKYIAFGVWGYKPGDYSFRNVQDPVPGRNNPSISISADCSSKIGSTVNISGVLRDFNSTPLQNKTVVLQYTFPGLESWIPISSCLTNEQGEYSIQWINSASGTFTLKTQWNGDSSNMATSNATTLSFLPYQNQQVFSFESNSTVSALSFNNETATLSFNVTGPSGTTGFVKATIAKSLLANVEKLQTYIDGKQLAYSVTSSGDSWVYNFNYSHSTHQISMKLNTAQSPLPSGNEIILIAIIATLGATVAFEVYSVIRKNKVKSEVQSNSG